MIRVRSIPWLRSQRARPGASQECLRSFADGYHEQFFAAAPRASAETKMDPEATGFRLDFALLIPLTSTRFVVVTYLPSLEMFVGPNPNAWV